MIGIPGQVQIEGQKGSPQQGGMAMSAGVTMPPEEQEILKQAASMFHRASQFRSRWDRHWPRFWNLWEGNHYYTKVVHTLTRGIINQVFSAIETFVGHTADVLTYPNVFGRDPRWKGNAEAITQWLRSCWDMSGAETQLQHVIRSSAVTGIGWIEIPWDWSASDGKGEPAFIPKDERTMYGSPYAKTVKEALYLIDVQNVPREFMEKAWPERAKNVPPGIWYPQVANERVYTGASPELDQYAEFLTTDQSQSGWGRLAASDPKSARDLVTLMKIWLKRSDGKMRLLPISNGVILDPTFTAPDGGLSPYDDDQFPYVNLNLIPTLDTMYGRSLVQFIESLQEVVDLSLSYLLDCQRYAADPMLLVNHLNIEEGHLIENMPGAVLFDRTEGTSGYRWEQGPGFNHQWMEIVENIIQAMDSVLGRVDVLKGERPAGVDTLGGLEIVRDEANVRVRNLHRWVKLSVKQCYLLMLSRLRQFVQDERTLLITNKNQKGYIVVNPIKGSNPLTGALIQDKTIPDDAEFDLQFGPEEAGGEQARQEFVTQLLSMRGEDGLPLVTRNWALEKLNVQEIDQINNELDKVKQAQQQAQQAQAQAQQGPPSTGNPQEDANELEQQDPQRALSALFSPAT